MYIIAKDGSGDFTSLQAAIDAVPMSSRMPTILLLRMDEYHEKVIVNKDNIRIIGEATAPSSPTPAVPRIWTRTERRRARSSATRFWSRGITWRWRT